MMILIGGLIVFFLAFGLSLRPKFNSITQLSPSPTSSKSSSPTPKDFSNSNSLEEAVNAALEGAKGTYGIVIKNLKNNEAYYLNEHKVFEPGSLYKLWILGESYQQIENDSLKKDEILSDTIQNLNKEFYIDSDNAELTEGTVTMSVSSALSQMITISHNYAALLLTKKIKLSRVAAFLKENGFNESSVGTHGEHPTSTPTDMAIFFEKLYKNQLAGRENTTEMIKLLKKQNLNDKLPKALPENIDVAHKTGEINYFTHDAGIVFSDKGDYIIVVLSESDSPVGAEERISDISKAVYEYFQK